jgi:hypothetical protein
MYAPVFLPKFKEMHPIDDAKRIKAITYIKVNETQLLGKYNAFYPHRVKGRLGRG